MGKLSFTDLNVNGKCFYGDFSFESGGKGYFLSFRKLDNLDLFKMFVENRTEISVLKSKQTYNLKEPEKHDFIKEVFDGKSVRFLKLEKDSQGYFIEVVKSDLRAHENFKRI
ncbi:hypothetical protein HIR57_01095 [Staphylococcus coagulans]|uniref:hypothetical protein n=1 Tax=Staphylococcus coagulans TaxID=74706 RepID=UPI001BE7966B|nr:hypothetical protein [Staphylococcus coagulans]ELJ9288522.1 hypothetical protein [Staphylococcus pseudintermedius]MBT2813342.1 hypothetical protein [Staphylococcus coagulans]MBT2815605.1 hypothetical protein [Staphylococcus coagulans]MBT2837006.1 hypothetical protein [Staphylococcus coagulans]MBT2841534.1 hypothetical protein [Staphylococcus coagulans]